MDLAAGRFDAGIRLGQFIAPDMVVVRLTRPFPFVVDTGSNQTVIAGELAAQLGLTLGEPAPAACAETDLNLVDDAGVAIQCATPPPND